MSRTLLADDERTRAAAATLSWLATLWDRRDTLSADQKLLVEGCRLLVHEWAGCAAPDVSVTDREPELDGWEPPSAGDPYLALAVTSMRARHAPGGFRRPAWLSEVAATIPSAAAGATVPLRRTASLLHLLGVETDLGCYRQDPHAADTYYEMDDEQVAHACHDLAIAARFGADPGGLGQALCADLELPLSAIALAYLRDYRLDLGCLAVRTLRYLDVGAKAVAQAASFLLLQQQVRGCFGFLSQPGLLHLRDRRADLDLEVFLPTTFECVWTLAVLESGSDPIHSPPADSRW